MMEQEDTTAAVATPQRKKHRVLRWLSIRSASAKAKARLEKRSSGSGSPKTVDVESDTSLATEKEENEVLDNAPETASSSPALEAPLEYCHQEETPSEMEMLADFLVEFGSCSCVDEVEVAELSAGFKGSARHLNCAGGLA